MQLMFIIVLWIVISFLIMCQNIEMFYESTIEKKLLAYLVFIVFGPAIAAANLAEMLLEFLFPGGWDDNDLRKP